MDKYTRDMNAYPNWNNYCAENNLQLTIHKTEQTSVNNTVIQFTIHNKDGVMSLITQKFNMFYINKHLNEKKSILENHLNESLQILLNKNRNVLYSQRMILSYVNEEEAQIFNIKVGDQILYLEKEISLYGEVLMSEVELASPAHYCFKEKHR